MTRCSCEPSPAPAKYGASLLGHCADEVRLPMWRQPKPRETRVREAMEHAGILVMAKKAEPERRVVADNRKARYLYSIDDTLEAGLVLMGSEVKSLRSGKATIAESYAHAKDGEIFLVNSYIPEYTMANRFNHEPRRPRKILVHKREAAKLAAAVQREGMTLIPLARLFQRRRASPRSNSASPRARSCTTSAKPKRNATGSGIRRG